MQEIVSVNNELIVNVSKLTQKKYRQINKQFLIEGEKCIKDAILNKVNIPYIFVLKEKLSKYNFDNMIFVNEKVMKKISTTDSIPEIVAVGDFFTPEISHLKNYKKIAILENIKDGGNLGTIIRSACAFSFDAIILTGDCIDKYNPKVIRSSVGNIFKIPVYSDIENGKIINYLKDFSLYSTVVDNGENIDKIKFAGKTAIFFGSESSGLTDEIKKLVKNQITLPMNDNVESLNLAISASIIFWEMRNI